MGRRRGTSGCSLKRPAATAQRAGFARLGAVVAAALLVAACSSGPRSDSGSSQETRPGTGGSSGSVPSAEVPSSPSGTGSTRPDPAGLVDAYACRGGFTCGRFDVPLDRSTTGGESLGLQVAVEAEPRAPRGALVFLNGGPGAPGAPLAPELLIRLGPEVVAAYRIVALDARGTGPSALSCPTLQTAAGASFTLPPTAVRDCATSLGPDRELYGTDDVIGDLEQLRAALGVDTWTVFAISYGTFLAQQYAAAHPRRISALVLDSALPPAGPDTLQVDVMTATGRVLRLACAAARRCPGDPVADLARVVGRDGGGGDLLDLLSGLSSGDPTYASLLPALRRAARGDRTDLDELLDAYRTGFAAAPEVFSAALNLTAFCADQRFPWGRSGAPVRGRSSDLRREVARLPAAAFFPFDRASARDSSGVRECLAWPSTPPSRLAITSASQSLPDVPTLFVSGDRDLAAPVESVRPVAVRAPDARLVVVKGGGHVVTARAGRGRTVVREFLMRR